MKEMIVIENKTEYKNERATMAIRNCLFSITLEIPKEFPTWCVLAKLSANPRRYS